VFVFWYLVFAFPARYGKPRQAWARKEFFPTGTFSLQPFAFASLHAYILTMVRLLAHLEN
jgi:hypothetical protein